MSKKKSEPKLEAKERVDNGIILLEAVMPDWRSKFISEQLVLSSYVNCVLGQLFGDYEKGLAKLGLTPIEAMSYGFNTFNSLMERQLIAEWCARARTS